MHLLPQENVRIFFKKRVEDEWENMRDGLFDPLDKTSIENMARDYVRSGIRLHDTSLHYLIAEDYLLAVTGNRTYTILLIPEKTDMNDSLRESASAIYKNSMNTILQKRPFVDDEEHIHIRRLPNQIPTS